MDPLGEKKNEKINPPTTPAQGPKHQELQSAMLGEHKPWDPRRVLASQTFGGEALGSQGSRTFGSQGRNGGCVVAGSHWVGPGRSVGSTVGRAAFTPLYRFPTCQAAELPCAQWIFQATQAGITCNTDLGSNAPAQQQSPGITGTLCSNNRGSCAPYCEMVGQTCAVTGVHIASVDE